MSRYDFEIGATQEAMVNLEEMTPAIIPPDWTYTEYAAEVRLPNGKVRGMGFPAATWHWDVLEAEERELLRAYCADKSAEVYIRTPVNETEDDDDGNPALDYRLFQAVMIWPAGEKPTVQKYPDFTLEFRHLVEIEEESV